MAALALVVAVAWPMWRSPWIDSFPLSNYPMFSQPRSAESTVDLAVGVDAEGRQVRLDPAAIGGSDQIIQAARALGDSVRSGTTDALCGEIASRVSGRWPEVVSIQIATETHDVVGWFGADADPQTGQPKPVRRQVHTTCPVDRATS